MDGSYQLLAAQYVRKQTRQLIRRLDGVPKADDIESVHQSRVASRRLRAGLRIFPECFPAKKVKRWRKKIRTLTQGLGPARDKDVQIEFVRGVLAELKQKAHRPGVARLLLRLEQSRRAIQPEVVKAADRFEAGGVGREMLAAAEKMRSKLKKRDASLQSRFVFSQADEHISVAQGFGEAIQILPADEVGEGSLGRGVCADDGDVVGCGFESGRFDVEEDASLGKRAEQPPRLLRSEQVGEVRRVRLIVMPEGLLEMLPDRAFLLLAERHAVQVVESVAPVGDSQGLHAAHRLPVDAWEHAKALPEHAARLLDALVQGDVVNLPLV